MDDTLMDSTSLYGGSGQQKDPPSFLTSSPPKGATPIPSLQPDCSNGIGIEEMQREKRSERQKQKKRECDRRYRENKKKAVTETKNQLAKTIIGNENLKCTVEKLQQEIIKLTKQPKSIELWPEATCAELRREIKYLRIENEMTKCLLKDPNATSISNMIKVIRENEELKKTIEHKEVVIAGLTEELQKEMTKCILNDPNASDMIKVLKENEELKRAIEQKQAIIAGLTALLQS